MPVLACYDEPAFSLNLAKKQIPHQARDDTIGSFFPQTAYIESRFVSSLLKTGNWLLKTEKERTAQPWEARP
jgi:hypothetical protein